MGKKITGCVQARGPQQQQQQQQQELKEHPRENPIRHRQLHYPVIYTVHNIN